MKRFFSYILIFVLLVSQFGCDITTLYPIFTKKDLVYDPQLLGFWKESKNQQDAGYLEIERSTAISKIELPESLRELDSAGYLFVRMDINKKIISRHIAFLAHIGSYLYFDNYPLETSEERGYNNFYKQLYVRMHSLYRVGFKENAHFDLQQFDGDFVENLINTKQIRIRHEFQTESGVYIITSPTEELQSYLIKYAGNPEAYVKTGNSEFIKQY